MTYRLPRKVDGRRHEWSDLGRVRPARSQFLPAGLGFGAAPARRDEGRPNQALHSRGEIHFAEKEGPKNESRIARRSRDATVSAAVRCTRTQFCAAQWRDIDVAGVYGHGRRSERKAPH